MVRVAVIQLTPRGGLARNLDAMEKALARAAKDKPGLVVFPEMCCCVGDAAAKHEAAGKHEELLTRFSEWARRYRVDLVPGSVPEPGPDPKRYFNTTPYFDADGKKLAAYRKIHLFRAKLPDRDYDEGRELLPGADPVVVERPWGKVGLAICFDLRFPELFRALKKRGASLFLLPAAFTVPTGKAHWECLLKARAIENGCFVAAPGTTGKHDDGRETYGHSLFVSPWGEIVGKLGEEEGHLTVALDVSELEKAHGSVPSWDCRREDRFPIG